MNFISLRHSRMREILTCFKLDYFVSSSQPYINYFTDAIDIPGLVIVSKKKIYFYTDKRFVIEIKKLPADVVPCIADKSFFPFLAEQKTFTGKKIALDFSDCSLKEAENISKNLLPAGIQDVGPEVSMLLNLHDAESIQRTKKAVLIAKKAYLEVLAQLKPGITEIEVAGALVNKMRQFGGSGEAFPTIVAFGPNSARPHAVPTQRKLRDGDPVLIDIGSSFKGLHSDFTRTVIFGVANSEISKNIELLKQVSRDAGKELWAGASVSEYDMQVRNALSRAGIEKYFTHALGHGIGFLVHAAPRIAKNSKDKLTPGMIVTVEPGVYFEGKYGVRHEDMYLITQDQSINLTKF
jgi:Xaa-Pro aminopeptidase